MKFIIGFALVLGSAAPLVAQTTWTPALKPAGEQCEPAGSSAPAVTIGRAVPLQPADDEPRATIVRGQSPPQPPPFPGVTGGPPPFSPVPSGDPFTPFNQGVVNNDADLGGFWSGFCDKFKRCWNDVIGGVPGAFQPSPDRATFQSDTAFKNFSSPVTNPFFFETPVAVTELRPIFMWQHTPSSNPIWNGGDNYVLALRGSLAITPHISIVVNRLGWSWIAPKNSPDPDIQSGNGFSELMFGPKLTFIRNEQSNTVVAFGVTFDLATGNSRALQNTSGASIIPYFSIAQNFGKSEYGSFNFMNTTGYGFRTTDARTEYFFSSFHLDYDVGGYKRFYPMVELNWRQYTRSGNSRALNFEGNDLANFGANDVGGLGELTAAIGGRVVITQNIQWGIAAEFNVLNNSSGRHLDQFRLTTDFIFRY